MKYLIVLVMLVMGANCVYAQEGVSWQSGSPHATDQYSNAANQQMMQMMAQTSELNLSAQAYFSKMLAAEYCQNNQWPTADDLPQMFVNAKQQAGTNDNGWSNINTSEISVKSATTNKAGSLFVNEQLASGRKHKQNFQLVVMLPTEYMCSTGDFNYHLNFQHNQQQLQIVASPLPTG